MEAKSGSNFDPVCQWQHEQESDILMVDVPGFKKENLKVQITGWGVLKISGDRPSGNRFYKEVSVPSECNANEIHARFQNGVLRIIMPRKINVPSKSHDVINNNNNNTQANDQSQIPKKLAEETSYGNAKKIAFSVVAVLSMITLLSAFSYYMYQTFSD